MANILAVDDDAIFTRFYEAVLKAEGHVVTTASDGEDALRLIRSSRFDLIITDILLPGTDGISIIIELHKTAPGMKIIAVSAGNPKMDAAGYLEVAQRLGAMDTLAKPLTKDVLLVSVNRALLATISPETKTAPR